MSESDASLLSTHTHTHTHTYSGIAAVVILFAQQTHTHTHTQGCYTSKFDKLINIILLNHYYSSGRRYVRTYTQTLFYMFVCQQL